jgi:hypothetical protein
MESDYELAKGLTEPGHLSNTEKTDYGNLVASNKTFIEAKSEFLKGRQEFINFILNEASEPQLLAYLSSVGAKIKDIPDLPENYRDFLTKIEESGSSAIIRSYKLYGIGEKEVPNLIQQALLHRYFNNNEKIN